MNWNISNDNLFLHYSFQILFIFNYFHVSSIIQNTSFYLSFLIFLAPKILDLPIDFISISSHLKYLKFQDKKKNFCFKSIYIFSNESSNPQLSCPSPTTGREICVTEIITSHDLSPSSSPTRRAVEKPWNRYAGARGNRWKKEEHDTGAVQRMEQKWRKPAQRRRKGRKSKKRPEGLLAECGLEKWGHVFSVKLLESLARSSASSCFARCALYALTKKKLQLARVVDLSSE